MQLSWCLLEIVAVFLITSAELNASCSSNYRLSTKAVEELATSSPDFSLGGGSYNDIYIILAICLLAFHSFFLLTFYASNYGRLQWNLDYPD